jgi:hypothetical protein
MVVQCPGKASHFRYPQGTRQPVGGARKCETFAADPATTSGGLPDFSQRDDARDPDHESELPKEGAAYPEALASPSCSANFIRVPASSRSMRRFRAC